LIPNVVDTSDHWDGLYSRNGEHCSWFQPTLGRSLAIIERLGPCTGCTAIDVGSGASTLVDDLLARGFSEVTLADLSSVALDLTRSRLGDRSEHVRFIVGDITKQLLPERAFDLWHDRALFHFLLDVETRAAYLRQLWRALRPGGYVVIATFGPNGPDKCSGLPALRYDDQTLHGLLGEEEFEELGCETEIHETPGGVRQEFLYCWFRRVGH
jgi:ubiquinone/menaquinone biosynthesis C-methylase UbiE